jgi:Peptidase family C25/Propeptide_C25/Peptidase family C25, C terminal ig-like domain/Secretion system C-terminal sorting domain/CUB domain
MTKRITTFLLLFFITASLLAQKSQKIKLPLSQNSAKNQNIEEVVFTSERIIIREQIKDIELIEKETKEGTFLQFFSEGMIKTFNQGKPDLPVFSKLFEIPLNKKAVIKIISFEEQIIELKDYNLKKEIYPAQPSVAKSEDPNDLPFYKSKDIYSKNEFFKNELISFEDRGYLRNKHLAYIEISPFEYNPVTNTVKVINNLEIEIVFEDDANAKIINTKNLNSPYFKEITKNTINKLEYPDALISGPVKYVIVSDRMFEATLQPFIEWKTMKGFNVIVAYTDVIGTTNTPIKAYLKDLYDNPSDGVSPSFVLLVGDVNQVPTFNGTSDSHYTDLYYCEYNGDDLPEVFYGRFSAESIAELQPQIDKTLEVEKYEMPDPSYLENVVLVAGVDGTYASKWGNGAINYANTYYTNATNNINSYFYLFGDASGVMSSNSSGASASIRNYISEGISFGNYSAHCSSSGWSEPSFSKSHIDALTNEHMYPLLIGNCCQSNTFSDNDCFGEKILMAENKGAVGYIGGSNLTYWDEDYWWAVGASTIVVNPVYDSEKLGAYDRAFHLNGESKEDWYLTQGQMNVAGNLAVEASSSPRKTYYWEIYHLMGDPSLTPYVSIPDAMISSYNSEIIIGSSTFQVTTEEDAYVALSKDGILFDAKLADASGIVELTFEALSEVGNLDIVITKQNRQPVIDQIEIIPSSTPYVVLKEYTINDAAENNNAEADFGESLYLNITLNNVSDTYDAYEVETELVIDDVNVELIDSIESFGNINATQDVLVNSAYNIQLTNKIEDQQLLNFEVQIAGKDVSAVEYDWTSNLNLLVNAPVLKIGELQIDDSNFNNDGVIDPGETVLLKLSISNEGHAAISQVTGVLESITGSSLVTVTDNTTDPLSLDVGESKIIEFEIEVDDSEVIGTEIEIEFNLEDIYDGFYSVSAIKEQTIGQIPVYLISDEGVNTIPTLKAYFYDSGAEDSNYSNDEDYTITFVPDSKYGKLKANFISFSIEAHSSCDYDKLRIYDGMSSSDDLIGEYCGATSPGLVEATNSDGALTFVYSSDYSDTESGWKAEIYGEEEEENPTGIIKPEIIEAKVYPNPSSGIFNIEIPEMENQQIIIKLYNLMGSVVYANVITGRENTHQIDISDKPTGIYLLFVESDNSIILIKNIIVK